MSEFMRLDAEAPATLGAVVEPVSRAQQERLIESSLPASVGKRRRAFSK